MSLTPVPSSGSSSGGAHGHQLRVREVRGNAVDQVHHRIVVVEQAHGIAEFVVGARHKPALQAGIDGTVRRVLHACEVRHDAVVVVLLPVRVVLVDVAVRPLQNGAQLERQAAARIGHPDDHRRCVVEPRLGGCARAGIQLLVVAHRHFHPSAGGEGDCQGRHHHHHQQRRDQRHAAFAGHRRQGLRSLCHRDLTRTSELTVWMVGVPRF